MRSILSILAFFFSYYYSCTTVHASNDTIAKGNLAVVFNATSAKSGDDHPLRATVPNLWCQATSRNNDYLLTIKEAHFVRDSDKEVLPAYIDNQTRAFLELGDDTSISNVGKYRCVMTTEGDKSVWGWSFVNMRPVFHVDLSKTLDIIGDNHFHVRASTVRAVEGETVTLSCPVRGFPEPTIEWYKNDVPVASTEQITFLEKELQIAKVEFADEGIYSCVARNSFPMDLEGENIKWESRLDRELKVRSSYGWIYPLLLIILMLLLLCLIIYACSFFNRYRTYNVEKHEKRRKRRENRRYNENISQQQQQQPILDYNNG